MKPTTEESGLCRALELIFDNESGGFLKGMIAVAIVLVGAGTGLGIGFAGYGYGQRLMHGERPVTVYESVSLADELTLTVPADGADDEVVCRGGSGSTGESCSTG